MKNLVDRIPSLAYQVFFDSQAEAAVAELDKDVRRTVRATLRTIASPPPDDFLKNEKSLLAAWDGVDEVFFILISLCMEFIQRNRMF